MRPGVPDALGRLPHLMVDCAHLEQAVSVDSLFLCGPTVNSDPEVVLALISAVTEKCAQLALQFPCGAKGWTNARGTERGVTCERFMNVVYKIVAET